MIFSTSYKSPYLKDLIHLFIRIYNPKEAIDLGTQQGGSAILLARSMGEGKVFTFDTFKEHYDLPPFGTTHANYQQALENIKMFKLEDRISVINMNANDVHKLFDSIDLLHIDICNHYDNTLPLLKQWYKKVNKLIILEGGIHNNWQKKCGFKSFAPILDKRFIRTNYDKVTVAADEHYAVTILVRKCQ